MLKRITYTFVFLLLTAAGIYYLNKIPQSIIPEPDISVSGSLSNDDTAGYKRALNVVDFHFPADFDEHSGFKTEWWYFTGNLTTPDKRSFGYQLTFFRYALSPHPIKSSSAWRSNQLYMGDFTLTDIKSENFYYFELFSRGANELAGVAMNPFRIWINNWEISSSGETPVWGIPAFNLAASDSGASINLKMHSLKPAVLQGNRGLSQKGPETGNASYYFSLTKLETTGTVTVKGEKFTVHGYSWMDREWSTSALSKYQAGWDWFSLQLNDGREIMFYQIRTQEGLPDKYTSGTITYADGTSVHLTKKEVNLNIIGKWTSPKGTVYPSGWKLNIPKEQISLNIFPAIKNQELDLSVRYYEGAVIINGQAGSTSVSGSGYVELTGY